MIKNAMIFGAGGFIGSHLAKRLKEEGYWVRGVDLKYPEFSDSEVNDFVIADLRDQNNYNRLFDRKFERIYQLAADMGGAGYIFTGKNDADVMHNSATINLNTLDACNRYNFSGRIFYSSSACIYPKHNQLDPDNPKCNEESAYPADPDSEYGWEKLFSERLYLSYQRNKDITVRVARFHNIFGNCGTWRGGKEKAPAAICRKVAEAKDGDNIEIWGDGLQTRSFLFIDECIDGIMNFVESDFCGPVNIGSEEIISINNLAYMAIDISGKKLTIINIDGPEGVRGRNSDNNLIKEKIGWQPNYSLRKGIEITYKWINDQLIGNK